MRDLLHRISAQPSIVPATTTSTATGVAVDTLGYESVTLITEVAAIGGTTPSYTPKIQTSADGSTNWLDLDASAYIGGAAPAAITANGMQTAGVESPNGTGQAMLRFVRSVVTVAGTTPTAALVSMFVLGYPRHSGAAV